MAFVWKRTEKLVSKSCHVYPVIFLTLFFFCFQQWYTSLYKHVRVQKINAPNSFLQLNKTWYTLFILLLPPIVSWPFYTQCMLFQLELVLIVEKLHELRSLRIQKLKKQGTLVFFVLRLLFLLVFVTISYWFLVLLSPVFPFRKMELSNFWGFVSSNEII